MATDVLDDAGLIAELEKEGKEYDKDSEIDRILRAFRLNAYEVLDLLPGVSEQDIVKCYRKKSLLIHPDKTKNPSAPDAFDRLKKAHSSLLDDKERENLDEAIAYARHLIIKERKWTVDSPELKEDEFLKIDLPEKAKTILMDEELRRRRQAKAAMREEGRAQRKEDEEIAERKRKREHHEQWENTRDQRINSWRDFQKGSRPATDSPKPPPPDVADAERPLKRDPSKKVEAPKKKKPKLKVLG